MKIKLLALLITPFVFSFSYAAENNLNNNPLKNFYIGFSAGLGAYASGYYSGTFIDYSPNIGYNLKGFDIPARVELSYYFITGSEVNAFYDFNIENKNISPYIMGGVGSGGFTAGAGISHNINNNFDVDLGVRYGYSSGQTYKVSYPINYTYSKSYSGASVRAGIRYTF